MGNKIVIGAIITLSSLMLSKIFNQREEILFLKGEKDALTDVLNNQLEFMDKASKSLADTNSQNKADYNEMAQKLEELKQSHNK